jgi:hypothetical protein
VTRQWQGESRTRGEQIYKLFLDDYLVIVNKGLPIGSLYGTSNATTRDKGCFIASAIHHTLSLLFAKME